MRLFKRGAKRPDCCYVCGKSWSPGAVNFMVLPPLYVICMECWENGR